MELKYFNSSGAIVVQIEVNHELFFLMLKLSSKMDSTKYFVKNLPRLTAKQEAS